MSFELSYTYIAC